MIEKVYNVASSVLEAAEREREILKEALVLNKRIELNHGRII
jgi:hypothetical protein